MSRWSFLLFGGDVADANVRRMVWRISIAAFLFGFTIGFFQADVGEATPVEKVAILSATALFAVVMLYEGLIFYRRSDELVRHVFDRSLAISGLIVLAATLFYGVVDFAIGLPSVEMLTVAIFALCVKSAAWMITAWRLG